MTEQDARDEEWAYEQYLEHSRQAIAEFTADRLASYYLANPTVAQGPRSFIADSQGILQQQPTAAHLLAAIGIEVAIKAVFLRPIIHGLVHSESAAGLIAEMALRVTRFDLLQSPFFQLLRDHGSIDFSAIQRTPGADLLWDEILIIQKKRDQVSHRAQRASREEASVAIEVGANLLDVQLPLLAKSLGLHVHTDHTLCRGDFCSDTPGVTVLSV